METRQHTGGLVSRYEYEYDGDGNRTVMREWNATPAKRAADPLWAANPETTSYEYGRLSRLTGVTYPDGRHCVYTCDQTGNRLTEQETGSNGQTVKDREYSYNLLNQVLCIRDQLQPENSIRYEYNLSGDTIAKITGTLDAGGQIVPGTEKYRLTFTWDVTGKLRQVMKSDPGTGGPVTQLMAEFSYDYAGRRIRKDGNFVYPDPATPVPSETRCYIYDETAVLVEYTPSPSTGLAKTRQYLYGNDLLACERFTESGPLSSFYHQDALGSTVNLSTSDGSVEESYLYDAWGNYRVLDETGPDGTSLTFNPLAGYDPATGQWSWDLYLASLQAAVAEDPAGSGLPADGNWNRFTYTGHEFDPETGLYYFKARFYDPDLGRFLSEDPYLGDSLTPPSLHRYFYAYVNPARYIDLFGYAISEYAPKTAHDFDDTKYDEYDRNPRGSKSFIADDYGRPIKSGDKNRFIIIGEADKQGAILFYRVYDTENNRFIYKLDKPADIRRYRENQEKYQDSRVVASILIRQKLAELYRAAPEYEKRRFEMEREFFQGAYNKALDKFAESWSEAIQDKEWLTTTAINFILAFVQIRYGSPSNRPASIPEGKPPGLPIDLPEGKPPVVQSGNKPILSLENNPVKSAAPSKGPIRGSDGRFVSNGEMPRTHTRGTEYPSGYRSGVVDEVLDRYTIQSGPNKGKVLTADGEIVARNDPRLTIDHNPKPVVEHWNQTGNNSTRAIRNDYYNDTSNLVPRLRSSNSSEGGMMSTQGIRYQQKTGPGYRR